MDIYLLPDRKIIQYPIRGHRHITTHIKTEEAFIVGGLLKGTYYDGSDDIWRLNEVTKKFTTIPPSLKYSRGYHVALPVPLEFVQKTCQ